MTTTQGEFVLICVEMKAVGRARNASPPPISEFFYVVDGSGQPGSSVAPGGSMRSGDFLPVPLHAWHAFRGDPDSPADMLLLFTPGPP